MLRLLGRGFICVGVVIGLALLVMFSLQRMDYWFRIAACGGALIITSVPFFLGFILLSISKRETNKQSNTEGPPSE